MSLIVDLCCNDPDNGNFLGKVCGVHLPNGSLELTCAQYKGEIALAIESDHVRFGRLKVPITWHKAWYGNWCWDAVRVSFDDAIRILDYIRKAGGWTCDGGWCAIADPYEAGTLTSDILRKEFFKVVK